VNKNLELLVLILSFFVLSTRLTNSIRVLPQEKTGSKNFLWDYGNFPAHIKTSLVGHGWPIIAHQEFSKKILVNLKIAGSNF
jgi:hypothetical protein